jgi:hypothetical protein
MGAVPTEIYGEKATVPPRRLWVTTEVWLEAINVWLERESTQAYLRSLGLTSDEVRVVAAAEARAALADGSSSISARDISEATGIAGRHVAKARLALVDAGFESLEVGPYSEGLKRLLQQPASTDRSGRHRTP